MANVFLATADIVQGMCDDFKSFTGVTLNSSDYDDTRVMKFWTDAGALSSMYAQAQRVVNDFFPASASTTGLISHLNTRSLATQIQPQPAHGVIRITGNAAGITIPIGTQAKRVSDGSVLTSIQLGVTGADNTVSLFFESVSKGNAQNLDSIGQPFTLTTAIAGIQSACTNVSLFLDGRDLEGDAEMIVRIQAHDQDDNSGGNAAAYEAWALAASNQVVTSKCIRLARGPDTVDTYITAGTSDIQAAVQSGQPVTRLPSSDLLALVQSYITLLNPVTDVHLTHAPIELSIDITFQYSLNVETTANRSYCDQIITKVIQTYVYKARPQDILSPTAIERLVDQAIGDQIIERNCGNLNGLSTHFTVPSINIMTPRLITITRLV